MGSPELGRVIPVNVTEKTSIPGLEISAAGHDYRPRDLAPGTTRDHEGIHAGLGEEGEVVRVSIVPGPGYKGITEFTRPNALAAIGPHAVGANGTSWDVMIAGGRAHEASARQVINERHAEIVEISDELGRKKSLTGSEVDAARKRARMKVRYGEKATVTAKSHLTGEEIQISGVRVDGDKTVLPEGILTFGEKVRQKIEQEEAKKRVTEKETQDAAIEKKVETSEQKLPKYYDITSHRPWSERIDPMAKETSVIDAEVNKVIRDTNIDAAYERLVAKDKAVVTNGLDNVRAELAGIAA